MGTGIVIVSVVESGSNAEHHHSRFDHLRDLTDHYVGRKRTHMKPKKKLGVEAWMYLSASAKASTNQRAKNGHAMPSLPKITMPMAGEDYDGNDGGIKLDQRKTGTD